MYDAKHPERLAANRIAERKLRDRQARRSAMTVIGALSYFRNRGEMSPHKRGVAINSRIVGNPYLSGLWKGSPSSAHDPKANLALPPRELLPQST
jgi:hypothetical protein